MDDINIVNVEKQLVLGMRKRGRYGDMAVMIPQVFEHATTHNIPITGPPVSICHETTAEEAVKADEEGNADVDVAIPVSRRTDETDEIKCYELPGGRMAKIMHKGPYEDCGATYGKLFAWLQKNGKRMNGPTREVYLNDPREVPPEEILTEIYAPIE